MSRGFHRCGRNAIGAKQFTDSNGVRFRVVMIVAVVAALGLAGCSSTKFPGLASIAPKPAQRTTVATAEAVSPSSLDGLIAKYAAHYDVPEALVRRVIVRESNYNAAARNGPYYGLMQISHATATGMGYRGAPGGLLDAETNLRYAVRYLAGAYLTAGGNEDQAVRFYARGYYYDAKRAGLLEAAGLR